MRNEQKLPDVRVLIVEDDADQRRILVDVLTAEGFCVQGCKDAEEALEQSRHHRFAVAVLDLRLEETNGTDLLARFSQEYPTLRTIIHTGFSSFTSARDALNLGAFAYVEKLEDPAEIVRHVQRAAQDWMREALHQTQTNYRVLMEQAPIGIQVFDAQGTLIEANSAWMAMWGEQSADLIGTYNVRKDPRLRAMGLEPFIDRAFEGHPVQCPDIRFESEKPGQAERWIRASCYCVRDPQNRPGNVVIVSEDITVRKENEAALRASEAKNRALVQALPDALFYLDRNGVYLDYEPAEGFETLRDSKDFIGRPIEEVLPPDVARQARVYFDQALSTGEVQEYEYDLTMHGEVRQYEARIVPLEDGALVVVREITERRRLQKEILEISAREQRRIGQDLHDGLGQLLAGIGFRLEAMESDLRRIQSPLSAETREISILVEQAIEQTRALARGLNPVNVDRMGLPAALRALTGMVREIYGIQCTYNGPEALQVNDPDVSGHLYRIAQESITNALKHSKATCIDVSVWPEGPYLRLRIRDDGVGLQPGARRKEGLGLRIMEYRARMIGAEFSVTARPEGGTVVTCRLRASSLVSTLPE